ncbi:MAG TPA: NAD-dependent protein deacylase, partial [Candidatus Eisenbacteria bacterium]|nr:NAD-dependent protein deacylase [Candidatus Eisenbacteria bacterium]
MSASAAARAALRDARRLLVITGAGVSAESSIPTFRDPGGWWKNYRPEDLATPEAFERDPVLVWQWYDMRRGIVARAEPNPAHRALARAEQKGVRVAIVTQNVDDLHERAGNKNVIHVHGSLWHLRCTADGGVFEDRRVPLPELPPRCQCGSIARPHVVWFNEMLDPVIIGSVEDLVREPWEIVLVVGTEATFYYIHRWAMTAKSGGARLIEINPRATPLTPI